MYLNETQKKVIERTFENLYQETLEHQWKTKQLTLSYLTQLYIQLNRYIETSSEVNFTHLRHYQHLFSRFEKLVDTHFTSIKSATQYAARSEEHTSELQSRPHLVCRLLLEKKKTK